MQEEEPEGVSKAAIYKRELMGLRDITAYLRTESIATKALCILAVLYTFYFAKELLVPIFFAFWFYFLLKPSVNYLQRKWHISKYLASGIVLLCGFILIGLGIYYFSAQAQAWMKSAPQTFDTFSTKISSLTGFFKKPMEIFIEFTRMIKEAFHLPTQQLAQESWVSLLFASTWQFLVEFSIFIVVLYFLLSSDKSFLTKLITLSLPQENKPDAYKVVQQIEGKIWQYLFTRTAISIGLAVVLSILFFAFGVPNPTLWGVVVGILEFIPYIGALISLCFITVISVVSFDNIWHMLSVPIVFFIVINLVGNFLTPYLMGKTFVLDPVEVVLSIILLGWLWGVMGAFLAIPFIMTLKVILDNINADNFMKTLSE